MFCSAANLPEEFKNTAGVLQGVKRDEMLAWLQRLQLGGVVVEKEDGRRVLQQDIISDMKSSSTTGRETKKLKEACITRTHSCQP